MCRLGVVVVVEVVVKKKKNKQITLIDLEKVIDLFASKEQRRVDLTHPGYTPAPDLY